MANNNDFLSQFSDENYKKQEVVQPTPVPRQEKKETIKPKQAPKTEAQKVNTEPTSSPRLESFKEENRTKIQKAPINPLVIIIPCIVVLLIAAILIYIFVFPHIEVENFIGKTKDDMSAWVKQQDIDTTGIIIKEEYNFDADEGIILDQDPVSGKVKKDAKMTFTVSKGADPDESIEVPDLETMTKSEIEAWVKENKLSNTKVSTAYDDTVAEGELVSITYGTNVDSSNFTRGSSLKIVFSKGSKPADKITVTDFVGSDYSTVETWADKNKVKLTKTETFSDTVTLGKVISQSVDANKKINQGDSLSVVVSKGKGTKIPDFTLMTETEYNTWKKENSTLSVDFSSETYYDSSSYILSQTVKANTMIGVSDQVWLTKNLGNGFYLSDEFGEVIGMSYDKFKEKAEDKASEKGLTIDAHHTEVYSSEPKGTIVSIEKITSDGVEYSSADKLPLNVDIYCNVSNGGTSTFTLKTNEEGLTNKTYSEIVSWCEKNGAEVKSIKIENPDYTEDNTKDKYINISDTSITYDLNYFIKDNVNYSNSSSNIDVPKGATLVLKAHS